MSSSQRRQLRPCRLWGSLVPWNGELVWVPALRPLLPLALSSSVETPMTEVWPGAPSGFSMPSSWLQRTVAPQAMQTTAGNHGSPRSPFPCLTPVGKHTQPPLCLAPDSLSPAMGAGQQASATSVLLSSAPPWGFSSQSLILILKPVSSGFPQLEFRPCPDADPWSHLLD